MYIWTLSNMSNSETIIQDMSMMYVLQFLQAKIKKFLCGMAAAVEHGSQGSELNKRQLTDITGWRPFCVCSKETPG